MPQKGPMVMGHKFMGIVEEVGKAITNLKKGDRVVVPFPISCGKCFFCNHEASPACENSNFKNYGPQGNLNNLHVLDQLIAEDKQRASAFLNEFAEVYHYVIDSAEKDLVRIDEEIDFAEQYFKIIWHKYASTYQLIIGGREKTVTSFPYLAAIDRECRAAQPGYKRKTSFYPSKASGEPFGHKYC